MTFYMYLTFTKQPLNMAESQELAIYMTLDHQNI